MLLSSPAPSSPLSLVGGVDSIHQRAEHVAWRSRPLESPVVSGGKGTVMPLVPLPPTQRDASLCLSGVGALRLWTQGRVSPFGPVSPSGHHFWQLTEQWAGPACQRRAHGCLLGARVWAHGSVCLPGQAGEHLGVELGLQAYVPVKASGFHAQWRPPPPWGLGETIDN